MLSKARLGRISYLNVLPIYYAMESLFGENGFHLVRGTPAELNAAMRRGEVDLGSISAMEYGRHPDDYLLLPDLSISSRGRWAASCSSAGCRLRSWTAASPGEHRLGQRRRLGQGPPGQAFPGEARYEAGPLAKRPLTEADAIMAIGDEALCLNTPRPCPLNWTWGRPGRN